MKLRLPKCLMILALAALPHAWAAAVIGSGVSYDNGKGSYSQNPEADPSWIAKKSSGSKRDTAGDGLYCWANSAADMIQYWQDTYGDKLVDDAPNGFNSTVYDSPDGTRYLNVYEKFLDAGKVNDAGYQDTAIDWYFKKKSYTGVLKDNTQQILKDGVVAPVACRDLSYYGGGNGRDYLTGQLSGAFSKQGQSVGLSIWQQDPADLKLSNEEFFDNFNTRSHAVTCWGYETDTAGVVNALYLSDSDDLEFGVFKVHVFEGETLPYMGFPPFPDVVILSTDDDNDGYGGFVVSLQGVITLDTPDSYAKSAYGEPAEGEEQGSRLVPTLGNSSGATSPAELMTNTTVSGAVTRSGAGVKVGGTNSDGVPQIVMLVSEDANSSLTLKGTGSGTGLEVEKGSLASLANLSVSGYERGVDAQGKVYLYGDTVDVGYNGDLLGGGAEVIDGAGIHNTNYVEISGSTSVVMVLNAATGKGGGIYNADVASVSDNGSVSFNANIADQGGAVYNCDGSTLYIKDNKAVSFTYNRTAREGGAVYNKGVLSITGNGGVAFSGNTAASGNDIYNDGGKVNIADSGDVQFLGKDANEAAVVNKGELYLKSGKDSDGRSTKIRFDLSALDSRGGTTYVGRDMAGNVSDTYLYFTDMAGEGDSAVNVSMGITASKGVVTVLDHLKVNANEIVGVGAGKSMLGNAQVWTTDDFSISGTRLDNTSSFTCYGESAGLTLNNVVIDLAGLTPLYQDNAYMYDLSGMFSGFSDMELTSVYLDASSVFEGVLAEGSRIEVNFGLGESALDIDKLAVLLGNGMMSPEMGFSGNNVVFYGVQEIPEPATGTLGLLALAALCARRRRQK